MRTEHGHLTYCSNIHPGQDWSSHFHELKINFPAIKKEVSPDEPMGIGLRIANTASIELLNKDKLSELKNWLKAEDAYVFTINGFPYGEFHKGAVKDNVHAPDWTTKERLEYTLRLVKILSEILPHTMDGGISTPPISYRHWFKNSNALEEAKASAAQQIMTVVKELMTVYSETSQLLHLDIEPEPDGVLETGLEFLDWYENILIPYGVSYLKKFSNSTEAEAEKSIKKHVQVCYDVCHFALGYENHSEIIALFQSKGIKIGRIQISAALKSIIPALVHKRHEIAQAFSEYNEPVYLHQVIAKTKDEGILRYPDLPDALDDISNPNVREWRSHFHVPIFLSDFELLKSTQNDILEVLKIQKSDNLTQHLEVETYTWEVLPSGSKLPIQESIARELIWVKNQIQ